MRVHVKLTHVQASMIHMIYEYGTSLAGAATESWRNAQRATTARMYENDDMVVAGDAAAAVDDVEGGELKQSRAVKRPHWKVKLYNEAEKTISERRLYRAQTKSFAKCKFIVGRE